MLVSVSRAILQAGPERSGLRDAARRWRDDVGSRTRLGNLVRNRSILST